MTTPVPPIAPPVQAMAPVTSTLVLPPKVPPERFKLGKAGGVELKFTMPPLIVTGPLPRLVIVEVFKKFTVAPLNTLAPVIL